MGIFDNMFDSGIDDSPVEGVDYVMSPQGYRIMTEFYLVKRGYCCFERMQKLSLFAKSSKRQPKIKT